YLELFENYRKHMRHVHFRHVTDPDNNRVASQFSVELTDNDDNDIRLTNANLFYLEGGKFRRVFIYMSDGVTVLNSAVRSSASERLPLPPRPRGRRPKPRRAGASPPRPQLGVLRAHSVPLLVRPALYRLSTSATPPRCLLRAARSRSV